MSEEIKECIEDLLTVACCPGHDESCKNVYNYVIELQEQNKKYKEVLDKIKEYCNHKLEMLELQKRNIMQILTPENGYLKTDIEIEMQKYKEILKILEEIE